MKNLLIAVSLGLFSNFSFAEYPVYPGVKLETVFCIKGTNAKPVPYCIDSTPCKVVNGYTVCLAGSVLPAHALELTETCWNMKTDYTCLTYASGCDEYTTNGLCTEVGVKQCTIGESDGLPMISPYPKLGPCLSTTRNFSCVDASLPSSLTETAVTCDTDTNMNDLDWTVTTGDNTADFIQAATNQEFARQVAVYGAGTDFAHGIFPGGVMKCRDGYFGLKNCCKSTGGGLVSNEQGALMTGLVMNGVKMGAGYAAKFGAPYVYDLLMQDVMPDLAQAGLASMANTMATNTWGMGFGMYGFGTTASSAAGTFASVADSWEIMESGIYFNPYAIAISLAIKVVMEIISCTQEEENLANLKSKNLCHYVGSYCSHEIKILGKKVGCLETTEGYCCFNGLLAKGIEEGAHKQLGISWGSGSSPYCEGLSIAQLQSLDFNDPTMEEVMLPFKNQVLERMNNVAIPAASSGGSFQTDGSIKATYDAHQLCLQRQLVEPSTVCP